MKRERERERNLTDFYTVSYYVKICTLYSTEHPFDVKTFCESILACVYTKGYDLTFKPLMKVRERG